jgi:hypothetical protein
MPFSKNVFINCPFDDEYKPLLKSMLFTLLYLDFQPKISETLSSFNIRINQIKKYIKDSKLAIHDLSRSRPMRRNDLPRFNMPYELGLDIGCITYGARKFKQKSLLIFETENYHYQKVLSDIAGQDIKSHGDDPQRLVSQVRNWLSALNSRKILPGPTEIWLAFNQFTDDINTKLKRRGYTRSQIKNMPTGDYIKFARSWIEEFKS